MSSLAPHGSSDPVDTGTGTGTGTGGTDDITLPTPSHCTADVCLIPVGTGNVSVSSEIAMVQRLLQRSGLVYAMHSAGTTIGTWAFTGQDTSNSLWFSKNWPPFFILSLGLVFFEG